MSVFPVLGVAQCVRDPCYYSSARHLRRHGQFSFCLQGCELFTTGALALEALFKTPWWANFYAREVLTLHADFQRVQGL